MKLGIDRDLARDIGHLAAPVMLAMASQTTINQVDHALIGRLPSSESIPGQAALFPAMVLMWAFGGSLSAIAVGTQSMTARRSGEKNFEGAGGVMLNSLWVATLTSAIASIAGWYLAPHLFGFFTTNPREIELGVPYLQWRMLGVMSMVVTTSYKSWFDGLGKTSVHMYAAIAMNAINALLNVGLVLGKWGFPQWGVRGSAIASMISSYIGMFIMVAWSLRGVYREQFRNYSLKNLSGSVQWQLIKLSVPGGIATVCVMSGFGLFKKIVAVLDERAGHTLPIYGSATWTVIVILMFFFVVFMAYGSATATLVSRSLGEKRADRAEAFGWEAVKIGVYVTVVLGLLLAAVPDKVLHIFGKDQAVIDAARPILRICGGLLPLVLTGLVLTQALFGAGNTKFVMAVEFTLHFFCLVPLAYFCGIVANWGVMGVWVGAFVYITLLAILMGWKFAQGRWKEIRI